jgi:hypothetical protein
MSNTLGPLLTACTREHDWHTPPDGLSNLLTTEVDATEVVDRACLHGVAGCVHLSLRGDDSVDEALRHLLEEAYFGGLESHAKCLHDLSIAAEALDAAGIPWLAFKGPVLSEAVYSRPDLRSYGDLDLLVEPDRLMDATTALESVGGRLLDRNWLLLLRRMYGEVHVLMPTGTVVDLHWHVLNEDALRLSFPVDTDALMRSAQRAVIGRVCVQTLGPEDTLIHLALHACTSGGNRLVWCKDLEQVVTRQSPDWDAVVARAHQFRSGLPTAVMLLIASRALDFDVPSTAIRQLAPGPVWRRLAALADRATPVETWNGGGSVARGICRATRADEWASARALGRRLASLAKSPHAGGPHETDRDPNSAGSVLAPAGEPAAYFAAVARTARNDLRP